jgi:hypothetical protein
MDRAFYPGGTNVPVERRIHFKFTVDAGNAPALAGNPLNIHIASVSRVSQGIYRLTLVDVAKAHVHTDCALNVNAAGQQRWAQPGPVANFGTSTAPTVDILIVDNAGAVQDPAAANANNFVSGSIVCCDTSTV